MRKHLREQIILTLELDLTRNDLVGSNEEQAKAKIHELAYIYSKWQFTNKGRIRKRKIADYDGMIYVFFSYLLELMALSKLSHTKVYDQLSAFQENLFEKGANAVVDGLHLQLYNMALAELEKHDHTKNSEGLFE